MNCERCKEWSEQGLSDTCPACDLAKEDKCIEEFESECSGSADSYGDGGTCKHHANGYRYGALNSSVTRKLEEALESIDGVETMKSESDSGEVEHWLNSNEIRHIVDEALAELALLRSGK